MRFRESVRKGLISTQLNRRELDPGLINYFATVLTEKGLISKIRAPYCLVRGRECIGSPNITRSTTTPRTNSIRDAEHEPTADGAEEK